MDLSPRETETLIDLIENKLSDMLICDSDDRKSAAALERCLVELNAMKGVPRVPISYQGGGVVALASGPPA